MTARLREGLISRKFISDPNCGSSLLKITKNLRLHNFWWLIQNVVIVTIILVVLKSLLRQFSNAFSIIEKLFFPKTSNTLAFTALPLKPKLEKAVVSSTLHFIRILFKSTAVSF